MKLTNRSLEDGKDLMVRLQPLEDLDVKNTQVKVLNRWGRTRSNEPLTNEFINANKTSENRQSVYTALKSQNMVLV